MSGYPRAKLREDLGYGGNRWITPCGVCAQSPELGRVSPMLALSSFRTRQPV
jgi:hypothetical protein